MKDFFRRLVGKKPVESSAGPVLAVSQLPGYKNSWHTGDKWDGGFGATELLYTDYWTLRMRSAQLFRTNHYARGIVRRLVTNEINTGLHLEADPVESILGAEQDSLSEWSETVEQRFAVWGKSPSTCDFSELRSFGDLQTVARIEALVGGDVLVVMVQSPVTKLPRIQLIRGDNVQSPFPMPSVKQGHRIVDGVEIDASGRHVAFWVRQPDNGIKRLPARGEKSGRRLAWLVYGCDKRHGAVRGEPIMGIMLQALRDLDRYRDATLRKAVVNSILAMFVTRSTDAPASRSLGAGAVVRGTAQTTDSAGTERTLNVSEYVPGLVVDYLSQGEDIKPGTMGGTDQAFGPFEEAIVQSMAWSHGIPPEILKLAFSNNYSASQAAIHEFKMYLDDQRMRFGNEFCQPIYENWLISEALRGAIVADSLIEAWRDKSKWDIYGAWVSADWTGHVKPSTDPWKLVRGLEGALKLGLTTHDRAAREYSGTKFSSNVRKQKRELELMREAGITPMQVITGQPPPPPPPASEADEDGDEEEKEG